MFCFVSFESKGVKESGYFVLEIPAQVIRRRPVINKNQMKSLEA